MKFIVKRVFRFKSMRWEWMWTLKAKNGKTIATSGESYQNMGDCTAMISNIKGAVNRAVVEITRGETAKTEDKQ